MEKNFQQGVRDALPTALGYISIGLACGVVASPYFSPLEMGLDESLGLRRGFSVCHDFFDCRSFVPHEYCLNRLFHQFAQYAHESAYLP